MKDGMLVNGGGLLVGRLRHRVWGGPSYTGAAKMVLGYIMVWKEIRYDTVNMGSKMAFLEANFMK